MSAAHKNTKINILYTTLSLLFSFFFTSPKPHHILILKSPIPSFSSTARRHHHHHHLPHTHNPFNINIIIMSKKDPITNTSSRFTSPESLYEYLQPRLPPQALSSWGTLPGTKNIHNLWRELSQGESSLLDSTSPVRTVHVVTVQIRKGKLSLVEAYQEMSDGTVRERFRPLSEKMKPGETVESAVVRGVKEELGGDYTVRIVEGSCEEKVEERESSVSYPGLRVCYVLHSVEAVVDGLPDEEFCTEEKGEEEYAGKAVSVKKHFWKWVEASTAN